MGTFVGGGGRFERRSSHGCFLSSGGASTQEEDDIKDQSLEPSNCLDMTLSKNNTAEACGSRIDPDNTQVESFR